MRDLFLYGVPDERFYTDNDYDIPVLDIDKQADSCEIPWIKWGTKARSTYLKSGTVHFYTDDYKFTGIWRSPEKLVNTGVCTAVEVNYSNHDQTPRAVFLESLYKKRWLSRFWQKHGILIVVDLFVNPRFARDNLIGVPSGWRAYCTRYTPHDHRQVWRDWELACNHAGTDKILFITYGGGRQGEKFARVIQQPWIIDQSHETRVRIYG